jgi:hypothetical protein
MGNDNEVKNELIETRSQFLPEEIENLDSEVVLYSLEDEFAKTKKNKNYLLYLFIFGLIVFSILGTIFFTNILSKRSRDIVINIKEFDDLRLKDVLNSARKKGNTADILSIKADIMDIEMLDAILNVRNRYYKKEIDIILKHLPEDETNAKITENRKTVKQIISAIRSKYSNSIRTLRHQISKMKRATNQTEKSVKNNENLSNEDKLYALKMKRLKKVQKKGISLLKDYLSRYKKYMEIKYDPEFKDRQVKNIVESKKYKSEMSNDKYLKRYVYYRDSGRKHSNYEYRSLQSKIKNLELIINRLKKVPYNNSVNDSFLNIDYLTKRVISDYERQIRQKNEKIFNYNNAFDYILKQKPESGYIIDSYNIKNIKVYINKVHRIKNGTTALVFRAEDEFIGKIKFFNTANGYRAKLIKPVKNKSIKPFDKILLEVGKE